MTFPPSEDTSVTRTAGHEAQIFQVALGLCVSANLQIMFSSPMFANASGIIVEPSITRVSSR